MFSLLLCFQIVANETNFSGNTKANVTVTVFLRDVNEFNPVFTQLRYSANVSENGAVGVPVVQVMFDMNSKVRCAHLRGNSLKQRNQK